MARSSRRAVCARLATGGSVGRADCGQPTIERHRCDSGPALWWLTVQREGGRWAPSRCGGPVSGSRPERAGSQSRHSFSFGPHYAPDNTHFGLLLVSNDDVVEPGTGFETHPHRDMEIVTWVLDGGLVHQDSEGHHGVIYPGLAQRMSAGRGIRHSEKNDSWRLSGAEPHRDPVHFIQMWVAPDERGIDPGYEQRDITAELDRGGLVPVASGMARHEAAIRIRQRDAALTPRGSGMASRPRCPQRRTCTCTSPGDPSTWSPPDCWRRATPRASPAATARGSPQRVGRPRSWSGRCTPRWAPTDPPARSSSRRLRQASPMPAPGSAAATSSSR